MQKYNILELNEKLLPELQSIAEELGIKKVSSLKKEELVYRILDEQAISYAGIQAEKEKEKEAKKAERQTKAKKTKAAAPKGAKADAKRHLRRSFLWYCRRQRERCHLHGFLGIGFCCNPRCRSAHLCATPGKYHPPSAFRRTAEGSRR